MIFGMTSCKYVATTSPEDNKTKTNILMLSKIQFYKGRGKLHQEESHLEREIDSISITFEFQKNRKIRNHQEVPDIIRSMPCQDMGRHCEEIIVTQEDTIFNLCVYIIFAG